MPNRVQKMSKIFNFLLLLLLFSSACLVAGQNLCEKVDFDRPVFSGLNQCGTNTQFVTKPYSGQSVVPQFKPESRYFITNNQAGTTCGLTNSIYRLDDASFLKFAYFVDFRPGASAKLTVIDMDNEGNRIEWDLDVEQEEWQVFYARVEREISRARVEIRTEMVMESTMAVQYLNILNSEDGSSLCRDDDPITTEEPSTTTQEVTSTTEEPTTTEEVTSTTEEPTTTEEVTSTTEEPTTTEEVTSTTEEPTTTSEEVTSTTEELSTTEEPTTTTEEVTSTTEEPTTITQEVTSTTEEPSTTEETSTTVEPTTTTQEVTSEPTTESSTETTESSSSSTAIPTTTNDPPTITDEPPTESPPVIHRTRDILLILLMCIIVAAIILVIIFIIRNFFCVAEVGAYEIQRDESPIPRLRVDKDTSLGPIVTDANKPGINSLDQVQWKMEMMKQYDGKK